MNNFHVRIRPNRRICHLLLLGLLLLAAFLRFHRLAELPLGLYYDEAVNGLDAQHLLASGKPLIFYPRNNGRAPLLIYFQALALFLWGNRAWSLRLVSAFWGLLALPLTYRFAYDLFRKQGVGRARFMGIMTTASLAFSYWHLSLSRLAFRAVYLLPFMISALWLFWRGWQQQQKHLFVWSGIALGLSQYTYLPARLLPIPLTLFTLIQVVTAWRQQNLRLPDVVRLPIVRGLLTTGVVSLLVFAPLGFYFKSHPKMFAQRISHVTLAEKSAQEASSTDDLLQKNALKILKMFVVQGDLNSRHNLPGRPVFDILSRVAFVIGLIAVIIQLKQPQFQIILLWLLVMLLPTLFSTEAPHYLRAVGALPPALILVTVGFVEAGSWLFARYLPKPRFAPALTLGLCCVVGTTTTYMDYFYRWGEKTDLNTAFSVEAYELAQHTLTASKQSDIVVPLDLFAHPTFHFYIEPVFAHPQPIDEWEPTNKVVLLGSQTKWMNTDLIVLSRNNKQAGSAYVPHPLDAATVTALINQGDPEIKSFAAYIEGFHTQPHPENKNFGDKIVLTDYYLNPLYLTPGETTIDLVLNWYGLVDLNEDYRLFIHLIAVIDEKKIAQIDQRPMAGAYPTYMWQLGDTFTDIYHFDVPADVVPGKYDFRIGWVNVATDQRLPIVMDGNLSNSGFVTIGNLTVPDTAYTGRSPTVETAVSYGSPVLIELTGYDLDPIRLAEENVVDLLLYWRTPTGVPRDYTVFVHIRDKQSGELLAQSDSVPGSGHFPTSRWLAGETVYDAHQIQLPAGLHPTDFEITVGLYYQATGERLPVFNRCQTPLPDDSFVLGPTETVCTHP